MALLEGGGQAELEIHLDLLLTKLAGNPVHVYRHVCLLNFYRV